MMRFLKTSDGDYINLAAITKIYCFSSGLIASISDHPQDVIVRRFDSAVDATAAADWLIDQILLHPNDLLIDINECDPAAQIGKAA